MPESPEPARLVNARRFLMGITSDNSPDVLPLLSPEVVFTVPGQHPLAGVFHEPDGVCEHIGRLFSTTSGSFEILKWVDWLVGLSHVAALQYAQAQGGGVIYRHHHLFLVETSEQDLLTAVRVFFEDQADADAFFTNLAPG